MFLIDLTLKKLCSKYFCSPPLSYTPTRFYMKSMHRERRWVNEEKSPTEGGDKYMGGKENSLNQNSFNVKTI